MSIVSEMEDSETLDILERRREARVAKARQSDGR